MLPQLGYPNEPIAIVGSACRFPGGATTPSRLWQLLERPRDVLSTIPASRFNADKFYHPDGYHQGTSNVRQSYLLTEDCRVFDANFFSIKPIEATAMDPQQRILLEVVYEALESAGLPMLELRGSATGVFAGAMTEDYSTIVGRDIGNIPAYLASGTSRSIISNRVSHFFDFRGPSMTIDTACSSSLVAVHLAVQSIRSNESKIAVVTGSNLLLAPEQYIAESKLQMLSPSSRSRMWDRQADGYARGDGFAVFILKPLSRALADRDSIECIIRETGVNQDGHTLGVTMPSPVAQSNLILQTYRKAGLDTSEYYDRPQYFEAHGTGTPVGDPIEAEAIHTAFFGSHTSHLTDTEGLPLYVGSIKTVLGHSEGAAGLAGILKASLAIRNAIIPPNLLLEELNPKIEPYTSKLKVPVRPHEWPNLPQGTPRRASVNSFGFGGTNAHVILESYVSSQSDDALKASDTTGITGILIPFTFSAASEESLRKYLNVFAEYLQLNQGINVQDLAWTLNARRSALPIRTSFTAESVQTLINKITESFGSSLGSSMSNKSMSISGKKPMVLGVFTGQGAQWAMMGAKLLQCSQLVSDCLEELQQSLNTLPFNHVPLWSLKDELLKEPAKSRINEAAIAQPLVTAIQISLVQLFSAAGLELSAVIGHSSGEIAASYASGYFSARDAIRIAYYRGLFLSSSPGLHEETGAMLASSITSDDAQELCGLPCLKGRICIAALNSPVNVTLSGDEDAIQIAKEILDDEDKPSQKLKVDRAYHSHHMLRFVPRYLDALKSCKIRAQTPSPTQPAWFSSVTGLAIDGDPERLESSYWGDNMANVVQFSQSIESVLRRFGQPDMIIEFGPHPALRKPIFETLQGSSSDTVNYTGTLVRGQNDTETLANASGAIWTHLGPDSFDLGEYVNHTTSNSLPEPRLLKELPFYSWEHSRYFWHETRHSRAYRSNGSARNQLIGTECADNTNKELRFRNYLSLRENPWLSDHKVQNQIVFPAAGYISAVLEAVARFTSADGFSLVEIFDLCIGRAIVISETQPAEILLTVKIIDNGSAYCDALFFFSSEDDEEDNTLIENASGRVRVHQKHSPRGSLPIPNLIKGGQALFTKVESKIFYDFARELGFGYEGYFRALGKLSRANGVATGVISTTAAKHTAYQPLLLHPAIIDCAIQSIMLAYSYPGDGLLRSLCLPTSIDVIRINMSCIEGLEVHPGSSLPFCSFTTNSTPSCTSNLQGDVDVHDPRGESTIFQLQGLNTSPLMPHSEKNDINLFTETTWSTGTPTSNILQFGNAHGTMYTLSMILERVAYFYLREIDAAIAKLQLEPLESHYTYFLKYVRVTLDKVARGGHPYVLPEWKTDTTEVITEFYNQHPSSVDLKVMRAVGENLPSSIISNSSMLEVLNPSLLDDFYANALGMDPYLQDMARMVQQLTHRFAHMNILEVGAGVGAATAQILPRIDNAYGLYTYTDISSAFFEKAMIKFANYLPKLAFKSLDIEKPAANQGFITHSYDLIIASLSLHATKCLGDTLRHVRSLLKPGGYLIMLEVTDNGPLRLGLIFGGLSGWWRGYNEGRTLSPCLSAESWAALAQTTGFSGLDAITPHSTTLPFPVSVMAFQAVNDRVDVLRAPLDSGVRSLGFDCLTVLGNEKTTSPLLKHTTPHFNEIKWFESLADIPMSTPLGVVVSFVDAGASSIFQRFDIAQLRGLQRIFSSSTSLVWVSTGAEWRNPYKNIFVGLQRSATLETSDIHVQFTEFDEPEDIDYTEVASLIVRLESFKSREHGDCISDLLWQKEPHVKIQNGQLLIPRQRLSIEKNARYNSSRRPIWQTLNVADVSLSITQGPSPPRLSTIIKQSTNDQNLIRATQSLLEKVPISKDHYAFMSIGEISEKNGQVLVISATLQSHILTSSEWIFPFPGSPDEVSGALTFLYMHLTVRKLLSHTMAGDKLVVLNADPALGTMLMELAMKREVSTLLLTSETPIGEARPPWAYIHPYESRRSVLGMIPSDASIFVNMGDAHETASLVASCLPPTCRVVSTDSDTKIVASSIPHDTDWFQRSYNVYNGSKKDSTTVSYLSQYSLKELDAIGSSIPRRQSIISWNLDDKIEVRVQPLSHDINLAPNRTYWLVGLTGGLGLSLARWMMEHGARYIVLSSRHPLIDPAWIDWMSSKGCQVAVIPTNIIDQLSLRSAHDQIVNTMPPITGVVQGAMVLHDAPFLSMNLEHMQSVLDPKIVGSANLDELFQSNTLSFFVFFSSIAYTAGNPGQSAYGAANAFMASLTANRRQRGLAGSIINIGPIIGNGYISRELTETQKASLATAGFFFQSEQDLFESFAQAIVNSNPECKDVFEISTGLRACDDTPKKNWSQNPIFQHLLSNSKSLGIEDFVPERMSSVKSQLQACYSEEQFLDIIRNGVISRLRVVLQSDLDISMLQSSSDRLGVDSLVAVDLQSWFVKEVGVDIPVMEILTAKSIERLVSNAERQLRSNNRTTNFAKCSQAPTSEISNYTTSTSNTIAFKEIQYSTHQATERGTLPSVDNSELLKLPLKGLPPPTKLQFERIVPISFAQSRFLFLSQYVDNKSAFNVTTKIHLKGRIDVPRLAKAVQDTVYQHEALRTAFYLDETTGKHFQGILREPIVGLQHNYVTVQDIQDVVQEAQNHVFNISKGDTLLLKLLSVSDEDHHLVLSYHHIVMDGISFQNFFVALEKSYYEPSTNLQPETLQYPDFALRQLEDYHQGRWSKELNFWCSRFSRLPETLPLLSTSRDIRRPAVAAFGSHSLQFRLEKRLKDQIRFCSERLGVTTFHFHLATFAILIFNHTGHQSSDMCIGVADGNRKDPDVIRSIGLFLNLLPVPISIHVCKSFAEAVKVVKCSTEDAFNNSRVPFDVLLDKLAVSRALSHAPLFQAFFNYRKNVQEAKLFCNCQAEGTLISAGDTAYDISLDVVDSIGRDDLVTLQLNRGLYSDEHVTSLKEGYLRLLDTFAKDTESVIHRDCTPFQAGSDRAVEVIQGPQSTSNWTGTMIDRIDKITRLYGSSICLKDSMANDLTYDDVSRWSNEIASCLIDKGIRKGQIGLLQQPGSQWVCSFLAILRTGSSCVPLTLETGRDRLIQMAKSCHLVAILVDNEMESTAQFLETTGVQVIVISNGPTTSTRHKILNDTDPSGIALITHTSGSTGTPKAITIKHESYKNFIEFGPPRWGVFEGRETVLQQTSYAFDMAICQIFVCLGYGGTMFILNDVQRRELTAIPDLICSYGITLTIATPTEYLSWLAHNRGTQLKDSCWHTAISGGEHMTEPLIRAFRSVGKSDLCLVNCYGPAEVTFACADRVIQYASAQESYDEFSVLPNYAVSILDLNLNPVPIGVSGQISISGAGVADGYYNQESLTEAAFRPDIVSSSFFKDHEWVTSHLSGDIGRITSDGGLILRGRMEGNTQVKLRGIRVDLEDVEKNIVGTFPQVLSQAVVSLRYNGTSQEPFLVAFVVFMDDERPESMRTFLQEVSQKLPLPWYMKPSLVMRLEHIPMTASGKVDRNGLDSLQLDANWEVLAQERNVKLSRISMVLQDLWGEAIHGHPIRYDQTLADLDFFHVGGHSLALIGLRTLIEDRLYVNLTVAELFKSSIFKNMVQLIEGSSEANEDQSTNWDYEINWHCETSIPSDFFNDKTRRDNIIPSNPPKKVVLTGASGFLGRKILERLIDCIEVTEIHCIAVRTPVHDLSYPLLHTKVRIYSGTLESAQLGLCHGDVQGIFDHADTVIHAAADVSFMKTYHSLKPVNYNSTRALAALCAPRLIPIHYISSAAVAQLSGQAIFASVSVRQWFPTNVVSDGYTATKWASEVFLENANSSHGLPITIYRLGSIIGDDDAPGFDAVSNLIKYTAQTNSLPDVTEWTGYFSLVHVDNAAEAIVSNVVRRSNGGTNTQFVHVLGDTQVQLQDIPSLIESYTHTSVTIVPLTEWIKNVLSAGMSPLMAEYFKQAMKRKTIFPRLEL